MNNLYDLTKKIDALTYNSCQTLNALVRSCIASGSASGYKVTKYGHDIVLDRQDIYRLYNFYESWKMAGFPADETTFYRMLSEADNRWHTSKADTSTLATDAVVKHVQILKMTAQDAGKTGPENNEYWTEMLRNSASPNGMVSTAPIPLNLRTPLYDENLSVKSFSQYETYLFPMGYYRNEIMGTPGNGESYLAGGANWTIDVSDTLMLTADHIVAGNVTNPPNRLDNYGTSHITASWGDESYAVGNVSLALGDHAIAVADDSTSIGLRTSTYGSKSAVIGGEGGTAVGTRSLALIYNTVAGGDNSIAGNYGSTTGGWEYQFTIVSDSSQIAGDKTQCDVIIDTTTNVCYKGDALSDAQESVTKVLWIAASDIARAKMEFDLHVGDIVYVYGLSYSSNGRYINPTAYDGYARPKYSNKITAVTAEYDAYGILTGYQVTLENTIPVENTKYGPVTMGYIAAARRMVNFYNDAGGIYKTDAIELGMNSTALGHFTIAGAESQTVVGAMNYRNYDANFIVGTGSRNIYADDAHRANSLVVAPRYSYLKLDAGEAMIGVSAGNRKVPDEEGVRLYKGAFMIANDGADGDSGIVTNGVNVSISANRGSSTVAYMGVANDPEVFSTFKGVSTVISSLQGTAVISSGSYIQSAGDTPSVLIDTMLGESSVIRSNENSVAMYAEHGIEIRNIGGAGRGINIETTSYLTLRYDGLLLQGNTFGTLSATDESRSFWLYSNGTGDTGHLSDIYWANTAGHSGFYYGLRGSGFDVDGATAVGWPDGIGTHVFNSTVYDSSSRTYSTALIALPGDEYASSSSSASGGEGHKPHPIVSVHEYYGVGNRNVPGEAKYVHELAYLEDIGGGASGSCGQFAAYGYQDNGSGTTTFTYYKAGAVPVVVREGSDWMGNWTESDYTYYYLCKPDFNTVNLPRRYTYQFMVYNNRDATNWKYKFKNMTYSLIGQTLTVSFDVEMMLDADTYFDKQNGIIVPFMIGTEVEDGSPMLYTIPRGGGIYLKTTRLMGEVTNSIMRNGNELYRSEAAVTANAVAMSDGMIVLHMETVDTDDKFDDTTSYHVVLKGIAPFKATALGTSDNEADRNRAIEAQVAKPHATYAELAAGNGASEWAYPDLNGLLFQLMNEV